MSRISISLDDELMKALRKRAKENFFSVREMAEDIVRRSMVSWNNRGKRMRFKTDDRLVGVFSRERRGRPRKKKR